LAKSDRTFLSLVSEGEPKPGRNRKRDKPQYRCSICRDDAGVESSHLEKFTELMAPYWDGEKLAGGTEVTGWRCKYCKTIVTERRR
jgi:hypothetical protein